MKKKEKWRLKLNKEENEKSQKVLFYKSIGE